MKHELPSSRPVRSAGSNTFRSAWAANFRLELAAFAIAASMVGCTCHKSNNTGTSFGELAVEWKDAASGNTLENRDATFDFGDAYAGDRIPMQMVVKNLGGGPLTLASLTLADGDAISVGPDGTNKAGFEIDFTNNTAIDPGSSHTFTMFFTPHSGHAYLSHVTLTAQGTDPQENTANITLKGNGQGGSCDFPSTIDFGLVPVGATFPDVVKLNNPTPIQGTAQIGDITGSDAQSFSVMPKGAVNIAPMGTSDITFTFSPTEKRAYTATIVVQGSGDCPQTTVTLKGQGSDNVLSWTPTDIDYGYVSPGVQADRQVVFTNLSNVPITLTQVQTSLATDFLVANTFTIPGGGVATPMTVSCKPTGLGQRGANLTFVTGQPNPPSGLVTLKCYGGGPRIKVDPRPELGYGKVAFYANSPIPVTRKLEISNVGTKPPDMNVYGNLFLGTIVGGMPGQQPLLEVTLLNGNTTADEISIALPASYDPAKGLEATVGKSIADLSVTLTPKTMGAKEARITIHSNDSAEPSIDIHLTADAETLPPCNLQVTPTALNFGLITPPSFKDLPVTITNLSQTQGELCELSGIEIAAGSDPAYTIVGGSISGVELQPGASTQVVVRAAPPGPVTQNLTTLTGALTFNVNSPSMPQQVIPLTTVVGPSCLVIAPDDLDFGTVKPGCNSSTRSFSVYNICSNDVVVQSFSMQAAAGEPAGGPNCPGSSPCPEFILTMTPTIPNGGLVLTAGSAPISFQAKYHPIDVGADNGSIAINAIQSGLNVAYLVNLEGNGDPNGLQTDTFVQDQQPKADVLLTVDDSGSMADKQANLGANFSSFLQYALAAGVDWQIGVTTTDDDPPFCPGLGLPCSGGEQGTLVGDMTNPRILTPSTPNVQSLFQSKVNVGTDGSGTEKGFGGSLDALTPPKIVNENAGFLRYDANLAIVVVSDAGDQSTQAFSYYYNRFLNIKGFNRASMFTFSDIGPLMTTPPTGNCQYDDYYDSTTYQNMVTQTNGVLSEICSNNWATTLQNLGKTVFGFRTTFYLTTTPDLSNGNVITVTVNGQTPAAGSWVYDPTANAVVFQATATPGPGQTLVVTYTTSCL